jgi:DNA-binding SARP family transcriptional activator
VRCADCLLSGFLDQPPYLLPYYLVFHRQHAHGSEHLATFFWGDHPNGVARTRLRHALWWLYVHLHDINSSIDECLAILNDSVLLCQEACAHD